MLYVHNNGGEKIGKNGQKGHDSGLPVTTRRPSIRIRALKTCTHLSNSFLAGRSGGGGADDFIISSGVERKLGQRNLRKWEEEKKTRLNKQMTH